MSKPQEAGWHPTRDDSLDERLEEAEPPIAPAVDRTVARAEATLAGEEAPDQTYVEPNSPEAMRRAADDEA